LDSEKVKCFYCGKEIDGLRSFMALDRPYVNLPFHRECYRSLDDELEYVTTNIERIIEYIDYINSSKYTKNNKK
jgi:hypothetical protein